jgi:hypothetical protein
VLPAIGVGAFGHVTGDGRNTDNISFIILDGRQNNFEKQMMITLTDSFRLENCDFFTALDFINVTQDFVEVFGKCQHG